MLVLFHEEAIKLKVVIAPILRFLWDENDISDRACKNMQTPRRVSPRLAESPFPLAQITSIMKSRQL
jgi:hypothetical protein